MGWKSIVAWIELGRKVMEVGVPAWQSVKAALAEHGIEADNEALNDVIIDAEHRKAIAEAEAGGGL
jgi:hypothetical protein